MDPLVCRGSYRKQSRARGDTEARRPWRRSGGRNAGSLEGMLESLVFTLGMMMRVLKGGSELGFKEVTPVKKKLLIKSPSQKKNQKENCVLGAYCILSTRSEESCLIHPSQGESCNVGGSSLRPQRPQRALGPLTVWEARHSVDVPKEVAVTCGHVMVLQTVG